MMKKLAMLLLLLLIAGGVFFYIQGKDSYDPQKFSATLSHGLKAGSSIALTLPDQHDQPHALTDDTQRIIFAFTKEMGHVVKGFLAKQPADYLAGKHALFVADISPMPVVIRNTFAMPDLKKQNYNVLLIYDKTMAESFKKDLNTESIIIATIDHGTITNTQYATNESELSALLQ